MIRIIHIAVIVIGALSAPGFAFAQTATAASPPPHVPLQKTIGAVAKPEVVPSLIVFNSRGVTLQGGKLVLSGIAPNSIVFADRPVRAAGHVADTATGPSDVRFTPESGH